MQLRTARTHAATAPARFFVDTSGGGSGAGLGLGLGLSTRAAIANTPDALHEKVSRVFSFLFHFFRKLRGRKKKQTNLACFARKQRLLSEMTCAQP
jgi:hypothetical protein